MAHGGGINFEKVSQVWQSPGPHTRAQAYHTARVFGRRRTSNCAPAALIGRSAPPPDLGAPPRTATISVQRLSMRYESSTRRAYTRVLQQMVAGARAQIAYSGARTRKLTSA